MEVPIPGRRDWIFKAETMNSKGIDSIETLDSDLIGSASLKGGNDIAQFS
jgi:hypothetical protein